MGSHHWNPFAPYPCWPQSRTLLNGAFRPATLRPDSQALLPFAAISMNWVRLLGPVLGPFTGMIERRVAIKKANQSFGHITQFITEFNETLVKDLPPGLASSAGVSLTAWSRQGDHIISSLRLRSLRKQEMTIPLRITVGTDQVTIGDVSLLLSDSEGILGVITRTVFGFFST